MKIKTLILFCLLYIFLQKIYAQKDIDSVPDSLKVKSEDYLFEKANVFYSNPEKANPYLHAYIYKNLIDKDTSDIIQGFYRLYNVNITNHKSALTYIDSAINFNKNNHILYAGPSLFRDKGNTHYELREYKKALESYLDAKNMLDPAVKWNPRLIINLDYNIGLIMHEFADFDGAIKNFDAARASILQMDLKEGATSYDYLEILHGLSTSYWYKNVLDSALYYNTLQYKNAILYKSSYHKKKSRVTQALINYKIGKYQQVIDSISKYESFLEETQDSNYLAVIHMYKGKAYQKLSNGELAIKAFKKADTIIQKTNDFSWELEENYELLKDYYKNKGDLKKQLFYLEKLIDFKNILHKNNTLLKNTITTRYNTPKLIAEKEVLIATLVKSDAKKLKIVYLVSFIAALFLLLLVYFYRKRLIDRKHLKIFWQEN